MVRLMSTLVVVVMGFSAVARAGDFPAVGRVFIGASSPDLANLNQELRTLGIEEVGSLPMLGAEVTFKLTSFFEVGLNYAKKGNARQESSTKKIELDQDVALAVARIPVVNTSFLRVDAFAGVGGSNTTLKLTSGAQTDELSRREGNDWFASLVSRYGASAAIGYKGILFVAEGGLETNKVDSFKRTGTLGSNIQSVDLGGPYATIGILIDGVALTKK